MMKWLMVLALGLVALPGFAANKRLLLVTDSGGFVHDSVALAEEILKEIGPKNGFDVTCYRYTRDPKDKAFAGYAKNFREKTGQTVEEKHCGKVNAETLKNFDCVLFFTTGNPLNKEEVEALVAWVKAGGAVAGTHCGSDTLYTSKERPWNEGYGMLIGAYFDGHPWHQKIKINVEDSKHAAGKGFKSGDEITDEIYQFRPEPYSRDKLRIILSVDNSSIDVSKGKRADKDYAIAWCQQVEKGKTFYTSLGHRKEVWKDARFQEHLMGGLKWTVGLAEGESAPSGKKK